MTGAEDRDLAADAAEIARLAALDPVAYDRERATAADDLGVRVSTLDQLVGAARPPAADAAGPPNAVAFAEVELWPEAVDAASLLDGIAAAIGRHVVLPEAARDACALWAAHTWVYERFQHSPRLSLTSPAKRCGKSTLLDLLTELSRRGLKADSISASGVFRTVDALRPVTLLVDEADSFLGDNEELRGILNSGFERSGQVIRVVEIKDEWRPVRFATFCPVALAGIGDLPPTLEDRAIPVALQRKAAGEAAAKLRTPGARAALRAQARKLARWSADRGRRLPQDPAVPDAMGDREGDISVPLLAIADDAGGGWPVRARKALLELFGQRAAAEGTAEAGALLLRDLKALFEGTGSLSMFSADIVSRLSDMEERPWPEWRQGKPMTVRQLAVVLRQFGIRPATIRQGQGTAKGYYKEAFAEAWERYLDREASSSPGTGASYPSHRHNPTAAPDCGRERSVTPWPGVTDGKAKKSNKNKGCDGVTDQHPLSEGDRGNPAPDGWSEPL